jgi:hypothetical protein
MAVSRVGYCRNSARSACRNWRIEVGCADEGEYSAGDRRDGNTTRCMVCGGVEASCRCRFCNIDGKGDAEAPVGGGIGM